MAPRSIVYGTFMVHLYCPHGPSCPAYRLYEPFWFNMLWRNLIVSTGIVREMVIRGKV